MATTNPSASRPAGGLMSLAGGGAGAAPPAPGGAGAAAAGQQAQTMTPEKRQQFDLVVKQALGVLLQDETAQHIVTACQQGDPKQVVADAVGPLLTSIYASAKDAGAGLDMVTLLAAGIAIISYMGDMLATAGVITEQEIPQFCAQAGQLAVQQHNAAVQGGAGAGAGAPQTGAAAPAGMEGGA